jgi:ATP synthase protein I
MRQFCRLKRSVFVAVIKHMSVLVTKPIKLTEQDKRVIAHKARALLGWLVVSQLLAGLFVSALFGVFSGQVAALSALAGAGAYWLPNAIAALRLALSTFRPQGANPVVVLGGFLVKMFVAALLLWVVAQYGGDQVNWLAVLLGLIATLKGYLIAFVVFGKKFR